MADIAVVNRKWHEIADDLGAFEETLAMLQAKYDALPQTADYDERHDLGTEMFEVRARREALAQELAAKTDAVAAVLRRMDNEIAALENEEDRLHARRKTYEKGRDWLREYMVKSMLAQNTTKLKTTENTVFLRSSEAAIVTDIEKLGPEYKSAEIRIPLWLWIAIYELALNHAPPDLEQDIQNIRIKVEPMLGAIKRGIKSGLEVEGGDIQFNQHLVVL